MTVTPARRPPASGDVRACLSDFLVANYARLIGRLRAPWAAKTWLPTACTTPGCAWRMGRRRSRVARRASSTPAPTCSAWPATSPSTAREQLRRAGGPELEPDEVEDGAPGPQQIAQARSSLRDFLREVDTLPRQQRAVYIDVRIEGLPQSAAASRYGLSSRIVRRHLRDAGRHMAGMRTGWPVRRRRAQ